VGEIQPEGVSAVPKVATDTSVPRSEIDPILSALDPDRDRPEYVMGLDQALPAIRAEEDPHRHSTCRFKRGTITALIGPTGSGKSTYIRTLNRMNDRVPGSTAM